MRQQDCVLVACIRAFLRCVGKLLVDLMQVRGMWKSLLAMNKISSIFKAPTFILNTIHGPPYKGAERDSKFADSKILDLACKDIVARFATDWWSVQNGQYADLIYMPFSAASMLSERWPEEQVRPQGCCSSHRRSGFQDDASWREGGIK